MSCSIGDTATGKSESLEAFRILGQDHIRELRIIADDMGSLEIDAQGRVLGYGTEIGAFIRLDDLQQGYAFGQIDRAIIMSPQKVNARAVLPVTTLEEVLHGYPVDYPPLRQQLRRGRRGRIRSWSSSLARSRRWRVFREGAAMAKGTTTAKGLVHSYFANIFGPPQYQDLHDELAQKPFEAAFPPGSSSGRSARDWASPATKPRGPRWRRSVQPDRGGRLLTPPRSPRRLPGTARGRGCSPASCLMLLPLARPWLRSVVQLRLRFGRRAATVVDRDGRGRHHPDVPLNLLPFRR